MSNTDSTVPYGYCHCGCGNPAPIAKRTDGDKRTKGHPNRYINGHNRRLSPVEYIVQDTGYTSPCWIWQRGKSSAGYGLTKRDGKTVTAHRAYFEEQHGPLPPDRELHHLCYERLCVNTKHIVSLTPQTHSSLESNRRWSNLAKLTDADVVEMRRLYFDEHIPQAEIARRFGRSPSHVSRILRSVYWRHV